MGEGVEYATCTMAVSRIIRMAPKFTVSFEFFLINYSLFFGLVSSILACFLLKRFYAKILFSQIIESNSLEYLPFGDSRCQNHLHAGHTMAVIARLTRLTILVLRGFHEGNKVNLSTVLQTGNG